MLTLTNLPLRQVAWSFAAGVLLTALATLVVPALAQVQVPSASPTPIPGIDVQQMIEWCRQMMGQVGTATQGIMGGLCMGR
jgi:hypothetical protein